MIPAHLASLFWDVDLLSFDPATYPRYTIGRVLEYGDADAVAWLKASFSDDDVAQMLRGERRLSRRTANFWALIYGLPRDEVASLRSRK